MITWLMGAWVLYHVIALYQLYGGGIAPGLGLEDALHQHIVTLDIGALTGAAGPTFIITYGLVITFAIIIALYLEMSRIVRYGLDRNFSGSPRDLYGSIALLVITTIELFFAPVAWTSVFILLFLAAIMDVTVHVRYLHYFVRPGRA